MKVILVDDHAVVREGYRRLLELEPDCRVLAEFSAADDALGWLGHNGTSSVDVLVLDVSMPGRSGLDLLRHLRVRHPDLKVLIFSMHDTAAMVMQALNLGARGYVTKSSQPHELIQAVRRVHQGASMVLSPDLAAIGRAASTAPHETLSAREFEVLMHLLAGDDVDSVARRLFLSAKTVANYQTLVRQKLGVQNTVELVRYAQAHGLMPP